MKLAVENMSDVSMPTAKKIATVLRKLRSYGRHSFASLTSEDGSFVQVAGGMITCMLEWKDHRSNQLCRGYIDSPVVKYQDGTELVFGGGRIKLKSDEWLTINEVEKCFIAFLNKDGFPEDVHWRSVDLDLSL